MKITLCDKNLNGEIPTLIYDDREDALEIIDAWLSSKDFDKSVFVCFLNFPADTPNQFRDEQSTFIVSHCYDDIVFMTEMLFDVSNFNDLDYAIFEFHNYQEAFGYCADLKESF